MRAISVFLVLVSSLWGGYWFVGSSALEKGMTSFLEQVATGNPDIDLAYASLATQGFPNRFDTIITGIDLADTRSGIRWQAPEFRIFALSYKPNHIIADFPRTQTLILPTGPLAITSDEMRGSVVFNAETALGLNRSSFVIDNLHVDAGNWQAVLEQGRFATRQADGRENAYDISLQIDNIIPPRDVFTRYDPSRQIGETLTTLHLDALAGFDAPWNRFSLEQTPPNLTDIDLRAARLHWGLIELTANGSLAIGPDGIPSGILQTTVKNWRTLLYIAATNEWLPAKYVTATETVLKSLADASGAADTIELPLTFKNGKMSLGPLPLGPAPRFRSADPATAPPFSFA
jgi:hypothetical protein